MQQAAAAARAAGLVRWLAAAVEAPLSQSCLSGCITPSPITHMPSGAGKASTGSLQAYTASHNTPPLHGHYCCCRNAWCPHAFMPPMLPTDVTHAMTSATSCAVTGRPSCCSTSLNSSWHRKPSPFSSAAENTALQARERCHTQRHQQQCNHAPGLACTSGLVSSSQTLTLTKTAPYHTTLVLSLPSPFLSSLSLSLFIPYSCTTYWHCCAFSTTRPRTHAHTHTQINRHTHAHPHTPLLPHWPHLYSSIVPSSSTPSSTNSMNSLKLSPPRPLVL